MQEPLPTTSADYAALLQRALAVGATLTERLLDLPPDSARNPAADYHLLNRAMRQAILVLHKTSAQPEDRQAAPRVAARKQIIREVEDAIQYRAGPPGDPKADTLRAELLERLDDAALDADLATRPLPDIIADICRDFRVVSPLESGRFARRTPDELAELCALAARLPGQRPRATLKPRPVALAPVPPAPVVDFHPAPSRPTVYNEREWPEGRFKPRRAPLSTPSLMKNLLGDDRPEAKARDQR